MVFRRSLIIAFVFLFTLPSFAAAELELPQFSARYKVKISVLRGELQMSLTKADDQYTAIWTVVPRGLARILVSGSFRDQADFAIVEGAIKPVHFESTDTFAGNDKNLAMDFDYAEKRAIGIRNGDPFELAMDGPGFDRLSLQYALMLGLMRDYRPESFMVFDDAETKTFSIAYRGPATIAVPYGKLAVQQVQHQTESSGRVTTLWCAESLNYLPIRIEQHRDGKLSMRADLVEYKMH